MFGMRTPTRSSQSKVIVEIHLAIWEEKIHLGGEGREVSAVISHSSYLLSTHSNYNYNILLHQQHSNRQIIITLTTSKLIFNFKLGRSE